MLRNRSCLFGLGTGLIIAALVLQLVYEADKVSIKDPADVQAPLGVEQLREEAGELGYTLHKQDEKLFTAEEVEARIQDELSKQPPKASLPQSYAFSIGPGTDVSTIAYMLVEMGLIDDWREFIDEIETRELADSVQARYYIFKDKPDMQHLIQELTAPK